MFSNSIKVEHSRLARTEIDLNSIDVDLWKVDVGDRRKWSWIQSYDEEIKTATAHITPDNFINIELEDDKNENIVNLALSPKVYKAILKAIVDKLVKNTE